MRRFDPCLTLDVENGLEAHSPGKMFRIVYFSSGDIALWVAAYFAVPVMWRDTCGKNRDSSELQVVKPIIKMCL